MGLGCCRVEQGPCRGVSRMPGSIAVGVSPSPQGKPSGSEPEQERRQQLAQGVARLCGELQQLDLQIETAQREVMADGKGGAPRIWEAA